MIDDAFELTIDQIFDHRKGGSCFPIRREEDNENLWDLIVDLKKNWCSDIDEILILSIIFQFLYSITPLIGLDSHIDITIALP